MPLLSLGLMSGTSGDGISAALTQIQEKNLRILAYRTYPYPISLSRQLRQGGSLPASHLSSLNMELGERFAKAAQRILRMAKASARHVKVIGSHGHTIYHGPYDVVPSTLQIGEPSIIAERMRIPVVADFRTRDMALGGQGAPLIPFFDAMFFGNGPARAMQNIGGIANVTIVGRGIRPLAFDTGPGNCLIDLVAQKYSRGKLRYDPFGRMSARGKIDQNAIQRLWQLPYFRHRPPKSTGREVFDAGLLHRLFAKCLENRPEDVLATLTYFTAYSIAESYRRFIPHPLHEVIVGGGGAYNRTLMHHLTHLLKPLPVKSIEAFDIPAQAKEPAAFAYLALCAIQGRINHLPKTTGARRAVILGTLYPA